WNGIARSQISLSGEGLQPKPFDDSWLDIAGLKVDAVLDRDRAEFNGAVASGKLQGHLTAHVAQIGDFSKLAGRELGGQVDVDLTGNLDVGSAAGQVTMAVGLTDVRAGIASLDGLLKGKSTIGALIRHTARGALVVENGAINGAAMGGAFTARHDAGHTAAKFQLKLEDLARVHPDLAGTLSSEGDLNLSAGRLVGHVNAQTASASWQGQKLQAFRLSSSVGGTTEKPAVTLKTSGKHGRLAFSGELDARVDGQGGTDIPRITFDYGTTRLTGHVTVSGDGMVRADLNGNAEHLNELSSLFGTPVDGRFRLRIVPLGGATGAGFSIEAHGDRLRGGEARIASVKLTGEFNGSLKTPRLALRGRVGKVQAGGLVVDASDIDIKPDGEKSVVSLSANGPDLHLKTKAVLTPVAEGADIVVSELRFSHKGLAVGLQAPASVQMRNGDVQIRGIALGIGRGRLTITGKAGKTLDVTLRASGLQAAEIGSLAPELGLAGVIDGDVHVEGTSALPKVVYDVKWRGASSRQLRDANLPALALSARGTFKDQKVDLNAALSGPGGLDAAAAGSVDVKNSRIGGMKISGRVPLSLAVLPMAERGTRATGMLRLDVSAQGTFAMPEAKGVLAIENGSLTDPATGLKLSNLVLASRLTGRDLVIDKLAASASKGGRLSAQGRVSLDSAQGFPGELKVNGSGLLYDDRESVKATSDADLTIAGPLGKAPRISGTIRISRADITIPEQMPRSLTDLNIEHVGLADAERRKLGIAVKEDSEKTIGVALDIRVVSDGRIFVRGRGVEAELGGDLKIQGTTTDLAADGQFTMRRGSMALLGRRFNLTQGVIAFPGNLEPMLDLQATADADGTTITIALTGRASNPQLKFSSVPDLPQDEIVALLLFNRSLTKLSAVQLAQLATEIDRLGGISGGSGVLDQVRRTIGVDRLDVTTDKKGNAAVSAGSHIGNNVFVGVKQNAGTGASSVIVDLDITKTIKARGETGSDGNSKLGLGFEINY
ncbi:MAG: translocation/assembly module TamB domain-containing protein, partial [Hyphomicrobiaceae bacterium]